MHRVALISLILIIAACQKEQPVQHALSDGQFVNLLFDVSLAREASRTAHISQQDSLFEVYLEQVGLRYELTSDEAKSEIESRIMEMENVEDTYETIRMIVDSLVNEKEELKKRLNKDLM